MMTHIEGIAPADKFQEGLEQGKIFLQTDPETGECLFPPRLHGDGEVVDWIEASGRGTVHSVTVLYPKPPRQPYNVALVDLAEGARIMSRVEGIPAEEVSIGMMVEAKIVRADNGPLIVFHPV